MEDNNILKKIFQNIIDNVRIKIGGDTNTKYTPTEIADIINKAELKTFGGFYEVSTCVTENGINAIETIIIAEGVEVISDQAYKNMTNLKSVYLPSTLSSLRKECFSGCANLSNINLDNVKYVDTSVFLNTKWYNEQKEGEIYAGKALYAYKGNMPENYEISVKEGTHSLTPQSLYKKNNLKKVITPEECVYFGTLCISNCNNLEELVINGSGVYIDRSAFTDNLNFKKCTINDVSYIDLGAFSNNTALEQLYLLNTESVAEVYYNAFTGINPNCKIIVRSALLDQWKNALKNTAIKDEQIEIYENSNY